MHIKEQQETIDELRRNISEKTAQIKNTQEELERSSAKLQEKVWVFSFLCTLSPLPFSFEPLKEK